MKTLFYIIGGIVCLGLIIAAMYVALTIGLAVYIAHGNNVRGQQYAQQQQQAEAQSMQQSMQRSIATLEDGASSQQKHDADELAGKLPSLVSDPEGYGTEDNWLATTISREMAEMVNFIAHPHDPLPALTVKAVVDTDAPQVHVEIDGLDADPITSDFSPTFAWDPNGYAALARQLVGTPPALHAVPVTDENDALTHLLHLTGAQLAAEDVRLSANLQALPASWQDHEEAALLLTTLALRNPGGTYTDNRPLLCRATAHLALAQALRGETPASWPGLIAGAAIRTLSGRELDALAHLDNLSAQPDAPASAKPWIAALRTLAKQDWREAKVTPDSPLLLKIVWFQILEQDLSNDEPARRLQQAVPVPPPDPTVAPDQQKTNPETLITDWGRIAGKSPFYEDGDDAVKNAEYRMDLEFHELDEILKTENATPFDLNHLDAVFAEEATDTVSTGADGKAVVHVIGPGGFKAVSLGHIFDGLIAKNPIPDPDTDPAQAQNLFAKVEGLFKGVPGYDFARLHLGFVEEPEIKKQYDDWLSAGRKWPVWQVAYSMAYGMPGYAHVEAFYRKAVPFGTVFEPGLDQRYSLINAVNPQVMPPPDTAELERIKQLPLKEFNEAMSAYVQKQNALTQATAPKGPQPFEQELLKLDPDSYILAQDHIPNDKLMAATLRFMDYNLNPVERVENLDSEHLSDADRETVLRKHIVFDRRFSPILAELLRKNGKDDEAAEIDRSDLDDLTGLGDSLTLVLPLVDYDLDHGLYDEVLALAKKDDLTTENGQTINFWLMEKSGKLDEAEACAKQILATFSDGWPLAELYASHRDHFPTQYAAEEKQLFPDGMTQVTMSSFSDKPHVGAVLSEGPDPVVSLNGPRWRMDRAGLVTNEVVVALNGYRVNGRNQYTFIEALSDDPNMDFIVWRDPKFVEVKAVVPHRRLNILTWTYTPQP